MTTATTLNRFGHSVVLAGIGWVLRTILRWHQPDVLPDALIDAAELCVYGVEVSLQRMERSADGSDLGSRS